MILVKNNICSIVTNTSAPAELGTAHIFYSTDFGILKYNHILNPDRMSQVPPTSVMLNPWTYWGNDQKLASIRLQRDYLLQQSDWTALNDVPLSPQEKTAYENYRQQLRDFPDVVDLDLPIEQIIWPSKP